MGDQLALFKANIDKPLAAILTLNTIAHTVGAIGVGAQASIIWADANPLITGLAVPVIMTLAILLFSEIVPKTLGATYWKELVGFTVSSLRVIIFLLAPLVWMCQGLTRLLKRDIEGSVFSRSDFMTMAEIGAREGVFEESESEIISNLIRFESVCAEDIMTPRTVVLAVAEERTIDDFLDDNVQRQFSRIPTFHDGSKDHVTGFVLKGDLLTAKIDGRGGELISTLRRDIMFVQESFPLPELFNRLIAKREHIAAVVDEFGGMAGIVTMEDAIETLLGQEILDESDREADMRVRARMEWQKRAKLRGLVEEAPAEKPPTPEETAAAEKEKKSAASSKDVSSESD